MIRRKVLTTKGILRTFRGMQVSGGSNVTLSIEIILAIVIISCAIGAFLIGKYVTKERRKKCTACGELLPWGTELERCVVCRDNDVWRPPV